MKKRMEAYIIANYERSHCSHYLETLFMLFVSMTIFVLSDVLHTWHIDLNDRPPATLEFKSSMHKLVDNCKTPHFHLSLRP